jgi:hypothetical protein
MRKVAQLLGALYTKILLEAAAWQVLQPVFALAVRWDAESSYL